MLERHVVDFYWSMNREDCSKVLFNLEGALRKAHSKARKAAHGLIAQAVRARA